MLKKCTRACIPGAGGVDFCSAHSLQRLCCSLVSPGNVCIPLQLGSARQLLSPAGSQNSFLEISPADGKCGLTAGITFSCWGGRLLGKKKIGLLKGFLWPHEPENPCKAGSVVADLWALV